MNAEEQQHWTRRTQRRLLDFMRRMALTADEMDDDERWRLEPLPTPGKDAHAPFDVGQSD